jgi:hypothetical protein
MIFAGLANGDIVAIDVKNNNLGVIGTHEAPVCRVFWDEKHNLLMSLGFDNQLKFWTL